MQAEHLSGTLGTQQLVHLPSSAASASAAAAASAAQHQQWCAVVRAYAPRAASTASSTSSKPDLDAYPKDSTKYPCAEGTLKMKPRRTGWQAVPRVPKLLGLGGLIPFFGLSPPVLHSVATHMAGIGALQPVSDVLLNQLYPFSGMLQIGYGTAIVSFLGAVHWGAAMQSRTGTTTKLMFERYVWSVTPSLVVFPAAAWGVKTGSMIVLMALLATFAIDAKFNWKGALPKWYMSLRTPLAVGAMTAMMITLWHAQANDTAEVLASPETHAARFR